MRCHRVSLGVYSKFIQPSHSWRELDPLQAAVTNDAIAATSRLADFRASFRGSYRASTRERAPARGHAIERAGIYAKRTKVERRLRDAGGRWP